MDKLFIHASVKDPITLDPKLITPLPKRLGVFTTIQFLKQMPRIKRELEAMGKEITIVGQTLGCRADAAQVVKTKVDAFIYIGSGQFHPTLVGMQVDHPVFCYNPVAGKLFPIDQESIDRFKKKRHAALVKYLSAERVGILISTKAGQSDNRINSPGRALKMKGVQELLDRADKDNKTYYVFACETLNPQSLEDFPFIQCWVNTACSRIVDDKSDLCNLEDIRKFWKETEDYKPAAPGTVQLKV
jgi:2-(3-amino-3-carboxypropyl)histidine synthase